MGDNKELNIMELAKLITKEIKENSALSVAGTKLPTYDISAASVCCEGHCPCDSRNGGQCPCASRCSCDGKVACTPDDMLLIARLAELEKENLQKVLDVAPILTKLRGITPEK